MKRRWLILWMILLGVGIPAALLTVRRVVRGPLPPPEPARAMVPARVPVEAGTPASGASPLVAVRGGCLIGVMRDGKGINAQESRSLVRGGERYRCYTLFRHVGWATGGAPRDGVPTGTMIDLTGDGCRGEGIAFAVGGEWNALPRVPKPLGAASQPALARDAATLLASNGIHGDRPRIDQVLRIDLEGDGRDEVLYNISTPGGDDPALRVRANTYSCIAVRRLDGDTHRSTLVEGEFNRRDDPTAAPTIYRIGACLDVDGDGVQEIILRWRFGESVGYAAYRVHPDGIERLYMGGA
jgi:hypothetical protein